MTKDEKKDDSDSDDENRKEGDSDSEKKDAVKIKIEEDKPEAPNTNKYFSNVTFQNMNLSE